MEKCKKTFIWSLKNCRTLCGVLSLLAFVFLWGCKTSPKEEDGLSADKDPILRVGIVPGVPHLAYLDDNGNPVGMEIELLNLFAKEEGFLLETSVYGKEELFFALRRGEIDIAVPCNTDTYIKANFLLPCAPHFKTGQRVLVKESVAMFINDPAQLNSKDVTVLTVAGSESSDFAKKLFPESELISLKDIKSCLSRLEKEEGTVFLTNSSDAWILKTSGHNIKTDEKNNGNNNTLKFIPVLPPLTDENICWAVRRSNAEWKKSLDKFIAEKQKKGILRDLLEKYGVDAVNQ